MPSKQPKRGRLWLNDGSCIRLRPEKRNHLWAYDFVMDRTRDGRALRILTVIDEYTRECLAIRVGRRGDRRTGGPDGDQGLPEHIRSDNGPEFTAKAVRAWLDQVGAKTLYIEPGSPWENGYVESFNGKLRDKLVNREVFNTLRETRILVERYREIYNRVRPHSSLGYRPPAPETVDLSTRTPILAGLT